MTKYWKCLNDGLKSNYDKSQWEIGVWRKTECKELCHGFNASPRIYDAMQYVYPDNLAVVEIRGKKYEDNNKITCSEMKIVKAWKWEKKDSVALSIFCAELCIENFEKVFPNDDRPRKAIEAAKKWLKNPTKENESAASAAESAASAAKNAAWSMAASAAKNAAWNAAIKKVESKIEKWLQARVKTLKEIK